MMIDIESDKKSKGLRSSIITALLRKKKKFNSIIAKEKRN
uniref:Uncharacterized protein n=1 Tax=Onchocerca volvulus TaxID=6282 RepID=A0A8R1Y0G6_ONCVO